MVDRRNLLGSLLCCAPLWACADAEDQSGEDTDKAASGSSESGEDNADTHNADDTEAASGSASGGDDDDDVVVEDTPGGCGPNDQADEVMGEDPQLVWERRCFVETGADTGVLAHSLHASLHNADFNGSLQEGVHYQWTNKPAGLHFQLLSEGNNEITLRPSGAADAHTDADDVNNFGIEFLDAAFSGVSAAQVAGAEGEQLGIDFHGGRDETHEVWTDDQSSCSEASFVLLEFFCTTACSSCPGPFEEWNAVFATDPAMLEDNVVALMENYNEWSAEPDWWQDPYGQDVFQDRYNHYRGVSGSATTTGEQDFDLVGLNGATTFDFQLANEGYIFTTQDIVAALDAAKSEAAAVGVCISLKEIDRGQGKLVIDYELGGDFANQRINFALIQNGLSVDVWNGPKFELAPGTYEHDATARVLKSYDLEADNAGSVTIFVPGDVDFEQSRVVAFVDDPDAFRVLGATVGFDFSGL